MSTTTSIPPGGRGFHEHEDLLAQFEQLWEQGAPPRIEDCLPPGPVGRQPLLAELVKIDAKSIGVGQYQHDVDQDALKKSLDDVVISCVNGVGVAALMRLDILDDQPRLKICTGYDFRGKRYDHPIANISHYKHCKPVYEEMAGWEQSIGDARTWDDLPKACQEYIERIGVLIGVPIDLVGTGPRRDQFVTRGRKLFG